MTCTDGTVSVYSTLVAGSTNLVRLVGLIDDDTGAYPTTAVVTVTIVDTDGTPIAGAIAVPLVLDGTTSGANTEYRGKIPAAAALVAGQYVTVNVTATVSLSTVTFPLRVLVQ